MSTHRYSYPTVTPLPRPAQPPRPASSPKPASGAAVDRPDGRAS